MRRVMQFAFLFCPLPYAWAQLAAVPVTYSTAGSTYFQNFDGLPNTGNFSLSGKGPFNLSGTPINGINLNGWQMLMISGTSPNASFFQGTGSATGNGVYSLGIAGSAERALGSLSSGTGTYSMGVLLTNQTGMTLNTFTLSFTSEQWRKGGSGNRNTWAFRYRTGVMTNIDQPGLSDEPHLDMVSTLNTTGAVGLNGNLPENSQQVTFTVNAIAWKKGEQLLLRWDDADEAGNDDVCGIDNVTFSASLNAGAPSAITNAATNVSANSAVLNGLVSDNYSATSVVFEYDTTINFSHATTVSAVPALVAAGTGTTVVSASAAGLQPGLTYYFRIKASNTIASRTGSVMNFVTPFELPVVTTLVPTNVLTNTALCNGVISSAGGAAILEKGFIWSLFPNPVLSDVKVTSGAGNANFSQTLSGLPSGTKIYVRAYATNVAGTCMGNYQAFTTQTTILSIAPATASLTNAASVDFTVRSAQIISGLGKSNFMLVTQGITGASVISVSGTGNVFTITVNTGNGDGTIKLQMSNDTGITPSINNCPFSASDFYRVDKTPPVIQSITIPGRSMKIGDTIPVTITVKPDTGVYRMASGSINSLPLITFTKKNDSTYLSFAVIPEMANDIAAAGDIPVLLSLLDAAGNASIPYQSSISQQTDPLDANRPFIKALETPSSGLYKAGDTLNFVARFNEKIIFTPTGSGPGFSIVIGNRVKTAVFIRGSGDDSLLFRYVIQVGDSDNDGISIGSPVTFNNCSIKDIAGNPAVLTINNLPATKYVLVDAVAPVVVSVTTPVAAIYRTGNILDFMVTFNKKVTITLGEIPPTLDITIGTNIRNAVYTSGSGGTGLLFRYQVLAEDMDKDGIRLPAFISLHSSAMKDDAGNRALLELNGIGAVNNISINPITAAVSDVLFPSQGTYKAGDTLDYTVLFTEKIFVSNGIPSLRLLISRSARQALYQSGSGTSALLFRYVVQPGDEDTNGVKINTSISLNNSYLRDERSNPVPVTLTNLHSFSVVLIDANAPYVKNVVTPEKLVYRVKDTLYFLVNFSEAVHVFPGPDKTFIQLFISNIIRTIDFVNAPSPSSLLFRYIVQNGDLDKNGIKIDTVITGGRNIADFAGNTLQTALKNIGALSGVKIDGIQPMFVPPVLSSITICENTVSVSLADALVVSDLETGEMLTWHLYGNMHGTLSKNSLSYSSNGNNITTPSVSYYPAGDYSGIDTLYAEISDGINTDRKMVTIVVQAAITNNVIGTGQTICVDNNPATIIGSIPRGGNGQYLFQWEYAPSPDSTRFSMVQGIHDRQNYTPAKLQSTTWYRRKIVSGDCVDTSPLYSIRLVYNGFWTGAASASWHNVNNWCNAFIPDQLTNVVIQSNTMYSPVITDTGRCNQLFLDDKARLTINGLLQVNGNIIASDEMIDLRKGSLLFNGISAQQIPAATLVDHSAAQVFINNPAGVSLNGRLSISRSLVLHSGSFITNANLKIKSTAMIGASSSSAVISGRVSVEHVISGGKRAFHLLGHPFANNLALDMIKDSIDITGSGGASNGFRNTFTNQPSAFRFDQLAVNDSSGFDSGWTAFTTTDGTTPDCWKATEGIRLFYRGRPGQGLDGTPAGNGRNGTYLPLPVTLLMSGDLHTGDKEVTVNGPAGTYQVIANPYVSPIDLSSVTRGNGIDRNYWQWNPLQATNGGYTSNIFKSRNILPPFSAFIVKANSNMNRALLFTENCKVNETPGDTVSLTHEDDDYFMELRLESGNIFWDRIIILDIDSARSGMDKFDAIKLNNPEKNFYSLTTDHKMLSIDARPINNETVIPLGLDVNDTASFRIRVAQSVMPPASTLMLHDKYSNRWIRLEKDSTYDFCVTPDTSSRGNGRFEIASPKKVTVPSTEISLTLAPVPATDYLVAEYVFPVDGHTTISIMDINGKRLKKILAGNNRNGRVTIQISDLPKGIYLVEVTCGENSIVKKMIRI